MDLEHDPNNILAREERLREDQPQEMKGIVCSLEIEFSCRHGG